MFDMAANGKAILVVSSEIPELLRVCDRIYVMHEGHMSAELKNEDLTSDMILHAAFGRSHQNPVRAPETGAGAGKE
jgi:ABC-type sugar transport system ATPase subunit